jgi:hypothetical protein
MRQIASNDTFCPKMLCVTKTEFLANGACGSREPAKSGSICLAEL